MVALHPVSLALGALAGAVAVMWWGSSTADGGVPSHGGGDGRLHGTLVPSSVGNPAAGLLLPASGVATRPDYEWGYIVGPGDTAGGIAEAIVGDDGRYQELLLANPHLPTIGHPGVFLGDAWDFAPTALRDGAGLLLPLPWSSYIDQTGHPRGQRVPFPADTRSGGAAGAPEAPLALKAKTHGLRLDYTAVEAA